MSRIGFLQRLQRVGLLSLLALLVGGLVLILVGINAFIDLRKDGQLGYTPPGNKLPFRHGSNWSIQTWIAVIGAAFGLLSFGFSETYIHVFDSWSSRQSKQASGLDYGRYLNTQPRAPVSYGIRGFPYFATLRYFLIAMGIFASIAYKFVIVKPDVFMYENIDPEEVEISAPGLTATAGGQVQPWIGDVPLPTPDALNRAYLHEFQAGDQEGGTNADAGKPPLSIVMVNQASCFLASESRPLFYPQDSGYLLTRQIVMVANMTEEEGDFFITQDTDGWQRLEIDSQYLFDPPQKAIMEYRVVRPGTLQVQWARLRNHTSSTFREPVMQRVTYEMHYAVAQVGRYVRAQNCAGLTWSFIEDFPGISILSSSNDTLEEAILSHTPITEENLKKDFNTSEALPYYKYWVEAQVRRSDTSLLYGVSAVVRAVMASWAGHFGSGHLEDDDKPFGSEKETPALQKYSGKVRYPFYVGWRGEKNTGCYNYAAIIFIILGAFALVVMSFRVWLGPPTLTSWMGQHVYLAQTDALGLSDKVTDLATGHQVAHGDLGRLRLSPTQSEESMETYAMLQLATMSEEVHNGSRTETAQNSGGERGRALAVADAGGIST